MDPQRWKQIDEIFHAALEREPSAREAFLIEACKEDDSLRAEIESLIASHEKESILFETSPSQLAAEFLDKNRHEGKIAHYQILKKIGSGGMGEVYLAEDTRLKRKVALKLLPSEFTNDKDRIRRFEREARTISALNHPNILTIYDIGQFNSASFIASEYIDGETLRARIRRSKLTLNEILVISIQIAEALHAAHQTGIIHRDIKPENIMLRKDGYLKVLDFGLAKLIESPEVSETSYLETLSRTQKGIILGTIRYMSPEQARGLNIDARSDLFSFGIVLYEMVTSKVPFDGATSSDVLAAILQNQPPLSAEIPNELQWIITKALAKDVDERYQSAKDLLADIKRVQKQIEIPEPSLTKQRSKRNMLVFSLVLLFLIPLILLLTNRSHMNIPNARKPFEKMKIMRLTSSGNAFGGAISPDGKYVAYTQENEQGSQTLYLRQIASGNEIQILSLPKNRMFKGGLRFSTDGQFIFYLIQTQAKDNWSLYSVSTLGGVSNRLIESLNLLPAISTDGRKMAYTMSEKDNEWLMIADIDGSDQRKIRSHKSSENYSDLAWSPDSRTIAAILSTYSPNEQYAQIVTVELNGTERYMLKKRWTEDFPDDLEWLPNGSGLILTLAKQGNSQIYFMSYPDGNITPITNDSNDYTILSLTADSKFIATTQQNLYSTIWSAASVKPETLTQLTSGITVIDGSLGLSWTPNGHILYASKGSMDDFQIWQMSQDGKDRKRLTSGQPDKFWPVASRDGRYIAYMTGNMDIWRMDTDENNPKLLSSGEPSRYPHFTPDNKWLVYSTLGKEKSELIKTEVEGTRKVKLASERMIYGSAISPDGSQIAYAFVDPQTSDKTWIKIIRCDTGDLISSFPLPLSVRRWIIQWTPDGNGIAFLVFEGETSNLYVQPIDGSAIKQLTNFGHEKDLDAKSIRNFSWSPDGKHIAYSRGKIYYDLVLIEDVHK